METSDQNAARERLHAVRSRMESASRDCRRDPADIRLLAVSKGHPARAVEQMADLGLAAFGESYLQEAVEKIQALSGRGLEWHFIGPVQSNKTRAIAEHFDWVHSVDREKIIRRLGAQRPSELSPLNVCLQVNLDGEDQKAGCAPEAIGALADAVAEAPGLKLRGLMAIPAPREDPDEQLKVFSDLAEHFRELAGRYPDVDTLSAGMSGDLEAAVRAGCNLVRIGTALFGPRPS